MHDDSPLLPAQTDTDTGAERRDDGRFAPGNQALARAGGAGKRQRVALAAGLGLKQLDGRPAFAPYRAAARTFRRVQCSRLAQMHGQCGPGPSSIVASAALALAGSRYWYDHGADDPKLLALAAKLGDASARLLKQAQELAKQEEVLLRFTAMAGGLGAMLR